MIAGVSPVIISLKMIKLKKLKRKTANSNRTRFKIRTVPNSVIVMESGLHVVLSDNSLGLTKSPIWSFLPQLDDPLA